MEVVKIDYIIKNANGSEDCEIIMSKEAEFYKDILHLIEQVIPCQAIKFIEDVETSRDECNGVD